MKGGNSVVMPSCSGKKADGLGMRLIMIVQNKTAINISPSDTLTSLSTNLWYTFMVMLQPSPGLQLPDCARCPQVSELVVVGVVSQNTSLRIIYTTEACTWLAQIMNHINYPNLLKKKENEKGPGHTWQHSHCVVIKFFNM